MGTAPFTVPTLERLRALGHDIPAVYTQPPRPAGRGHKVQRSAVHEAAERLGLDIRTPRTLRDPEVQADFRALGADLAVVGAYGLLLPKPILDAPRLGCVNLHASLLPAGAVPPRSSARSWPATPRPGSASSAWRKAWTPARSTRCAPPQSARARPHP